MNLIKLSGFIKMKPNESRMVQEFNHHGLEST